MIALNYCAEKMQHKTIFPMEVGTTKLFLKSFILSGVQYLIFFRHFLGLVRLEKNIFKFKFNF
jgi:hypothetical protein